MLYTATEAANRLNIPPRSLRKFIRSSDRWSSAGFGGRYLLSAEDLEEIAMTLGIPTPEPWPTDPEPIVNIDHLEIVHRDPTLKNFVLARRAEREARLAARINEVLS